MRDITFPFELELARISHRTLAAKREQIRTRHALRANEMLRQIRVNAPRTLLRRRPILHRPGANFVFANRKERYQIEHRIRRANKPLTRRRRNAQIGQEIRLIFFGQLRNIALDASAQHKRRLAQTQFRRHLGAMRLIGLRLVDVHDDDHRLERHKLVTAQQLQFALVEPHVFEPLLVFELRLQLPKQRFLLVAHFFLLHPRHFALDDFHIAEQ